MIPIDMLALLEAIHLRLWWKPIAGATMLIREAKARSLVVAVDGRFPLRLTPRGELFVMHPLREDWS